MPARTPGSKVASPLLQLLGRALPRALKGRLRGALGGAVSGRSAPNIAPLARTLLPCPALQGFAHMGGTYGAGR